MKNSRLVRVICAILAVIIVLVGIYSVETEEKQCLMIVAHPDDETIFAGNEIITHKYFIVCLTNRSNKVRKKEFEEMLIKSGNDGEILDYPDKVAGARSDWSICYKDIEKTVQEYVSKQTWQKVVTHNPKGEYGHDHHKMTSDIVTKEVLKQKKENSLYYFGPYFKKNSVSSVPAQLDNSEIEEKKNLATVYVSQEKIVNNLSHIFPYEVLIAYKERKLYFK